MSWLQAVSFFLSLFFVAATGCRKMESYHPVAVIQQSDVKPESEEAPEEVDQGVKAVPEEVSEGATKKEDSVNVNEDPYLTGKNYQMGDKWSRNLTKAFHGNHKVVVRGTVATEDGLVSSNFTVLKLISDDEALFLAAVHALPECSEEAVILRTKDHVMHGYCSGVYSVVPETDAVIFSLKFFDVNLEEILTPVTFAQSVEQGDRLKFYTMGEDYLIPGYFPLYSDSDIDCLLISGNEHKIADPDPVNPILAITLWSLAVSCDVIHGDSGGVVVNRANELVGMVWTGAFPKSPTLTTKRLLQLTRDSAPDSEALIWSGLNYAVSGIRIFRHLQIVMTSLAEESDTFRKPDSMSSHP